MNEKKKRNRIKQAERPTKKHQEKDSDKRYPNPDDPYEKTGPPIKEMPITGGPHKEEILD